MSGWAADLMFSDLTVFVLSDFVQDEFSQERKYRVIAEQNAFAK